MPDIVEKTIYKIELDNSGYVNGVNGAVVSTQKLAQAQETANRNLDVAKEKLKQNAIDLKNQEDQIRNVTKAQEAQKDSERNASNVTDAKNRLSKLQDEQKRLNDLVIQSQKEYDKAAAAAKNFAEVSAKAAAAPTPTVPAASNGILPSGSIGATLQAMEEQIKDLDLTAFNEVFAEGSEDMQKFAEAINLANEELLHLKDTGQETTEDYKILSGAVEEGNKILELYNETVRQSSEHTLSYRTQITNLTKELSQLEQAGKIETAQYQEKQKELIHLTRAYNDQRERVRILASETRALDFGKAAIQTATQAFQAYTSITILAGGASEELQKKTFQLFAAMQLITSLEQLHNNLKKVSILQTNAQSAAQAIYTAVIGTTTGAIKTFRLALLASGIGVAIAGIAFLVSKLIEASEASKEFNEQQKLYSDISKEAAKSSADQIVKLQTYKRFLNDVSLSESERVKVAKEYNKTADETNKLDLKQINNLDLINQKIDAQNKLILQRALSSAALNKLTEESTKLIEDEINISAVAAKTKLPSDQLNVELADLKTSTQGLGNVSALNVGANIGLSQLLPGIQIGAISRTKEEQKQYDNLIKTKAQYLGLTVDETKKLLQLTIQRDVDRKSLEKMGNALNALITNGGIIPPPPPPKGGGKIDNEFEKERQRFLDKLAQIRIDEETGVKKINDEFALKLQLEEKRIADLLKNKKILPDQAVVLINLAVEVNRQELEKSLADFGKLMKDAQEKINKELNDIRKQNAFDEINLIQDEFERKKAVIDFNEESQTQAVRDGFDERIDQLNEEKRIGLVLEKDYTKALLQLIQERNDAIQHVETKAAQERVQLAIESFKNIIQNVDRATSDTKLIGDNQALGEIQALVSKFQKGKTSYETYKKELAAIQKKYEDKQLQTTVDNLQQEIRQLERARGNIIGITADQYDQLTALIKQKEADLTAARTKQATGTVTDPNKDKKTDEVSKYAEAVGQVAESVISFWEKANEAEEKALERSIAIQERRVTEAQKIAERGNASYLKMEEDRLKQLQIARENAARREIAINAAVQASQVLVGITGAISKIATPGIGTAEVIADIALIVSSLAAGYALVRSLQNNQPKFAGGTTYVQRGNRPAGTDTIPAMLDEGEAVISRNKNKAYKKAVEAIHHGTVPAEYMNEMVERYKSQKTMPQVNYDRIGNTTEMKVTSDGKLAMLISDQNKKIDENNDLQRRTLSAMKNMSVNATIDRNGVAIAVNEYIEKMEIDKHT